MTRVPLTFLDLAPVSRGRSRKDALDDAVTMARTAEESGYARYWMAEHHGSASFLSCATSVLLARAAEHTSTIRLGAGGVMLPNHSPLMVAEHYGTLATIYGQRFDLGIGRAPGTDPLTAAALRRGGAATIDVATDIEDLLGYLDAVPPSEGAPVARGAEAAALGLTLAPNQLAHEIRAIPGEGESIPLWILASSLGGATLAAHLGLPLSFASHFAPQMLGQALTHYRDTFTREAPTAQITMPYVMAGVNVLVAQTQAEAEHLFSTYVAFRRDLARGRAREFAPPDPSVRREVSEGVDPRAMVGTAETVVAQLEEFVDRWHLDEIVVTTYAWDPVARRASVAALADAWGAPKRAAGG